MSFFLQRLKLTFYHPEFIITVKANRNISLDLIIPIDLLQIDTRAVPCALCVQYCAYGTLCIMRTVLRVWYPMHYAYSTARMVPYALCVQYCARIDTTKSIAIIKLASRFVVKILIFIFVKGVHHDFSKIEILTAERDANLIIQIFKKTKFWTKMRNFWKFR